MKERKTPRGSIFDACKGRITIIQVSFSQTEDHKSFQLFISFHRHNHDSSRLNYHAECVVRASMREEWTSI